MFRLNAQRVPVSNTGNMRTCAHCNVSKPPTEYYRDSKASDRLRWICKPCHSTNMRKWWQNNQGRRRGYTLKRLHQITLDHYESLLRQQHGVCAICRKPPSRSNMTEMVLDVDHDHKSGKIRGLLCRSCNGGLGLFKDSPHLMLAAIDYLKQCD